MLVLAILVAVMSIGGFSASKSVKQSHRDSVTNDLQLISTSCADALYDLGAPSFDPATPEGLTQFTTYLKELEAQYVSLVFDDTTIKVEPNGFTVMVKTPLDAFEQPYQCWFTTKGEGTKYIMMASGGEDGVIDSGTYPLQDYKDDLVMLVKSK